MTKAAFLTPILAFAGASSLAAQEPLATMPDVNAGETPLILWILFAASVTVVLSLDLLVFNRTAHRMGVKEALRWVVVWVVLALLFNVGVWYWRGPKHGSDFLTGYLVELNLSVDNLFVFLVIFTYFGVTPEHQPRVLSWGIFGAVALRMAFIFLGIAAVQQFEWLRYVFGAFLIFTGLKLLYGTEEQPDLEKNWVVRLTRRLLPLTNEYHGQDFFVREASDSSLPGNDAPAPRSRKRWVATPLFLVLVVIDVTDVIFAVDSVPAIIGITTDRFIAFTSNVFAVLGLRSMFFVLTAFLDKFHFLNYGLSLVLVFIGVKMLIEQWVHIPSRIALLCVLGILGTAVLVSLLFPPKAKPLPPEEDGKESAGDDDNGG